MPMPILILLWLLARALLQHLLLILLYAGLISDALAGAGITGWGVLALLAMAFGGVGTAVLWRYHYPRRKLLRVHLLGGLAGVLAAALHPLAVIAALLLCLILIALPCHDGIRLDLPAQEPR
jgi:hypothetical protein